MALTAVPFPLLHTTAYVFSYYICPQSSRALPLIFPKEDINILSLRAVSTARLLRKKMKVSGELELRVNMYACYFISAKMFYCKTLMLYNCPEITNTEND